MVRSRVSSLHHLMILGICQGWNLIVLELTGRLQQGPSWHPTRAENQQVGDR